MPPLSDAGKIHNDRSRIHVENAVAAKREAVDVISAMLKVARGTPAQVQVAVLPWGQGHGLISGVGASRHSRGARAGDVLVSGRWGRTRRWRRRIRYQSVEQDRSTGHLGSSALCEARHRCLTAIPGDRRGQRCRAVDGALASVQSEVPVGANVAAAELRGMSCSLATELKLSTVLPPLITMLPQLFAVAKMASE